MECIRIYQILPILQHFDAVLSNEGLVGRINSLGVFTADVMLVQDIRSSVPIITSESSLHASLKGMGLGRMGELQFIKKTAQFQEGEKVYPIRCSLHSESLTRSH